MQKNHEMLTIRITSNQKNQLKRMADLAQKSVSDYVRDSALSIKSDSTKSDFNQPINSKLKAQKKNQLITVRLLLHVLFNQSQNNDLVQATYDKVVAEVEKVLSNPVNVK